VIQFLVTTLSNASIYALIAVSLNVVYRSSGILNFGAGYMVAISGIFYVNEMSANVVGIVVTMLAAVLLGLVTYFVSTWWGSVSGWSWTSSPGGSGRPRASRPTR
jgi:branched-chain amino acid transport system permease protein